MGDPRDPLHGQPVAVDGRRSAQGKPEHGAHDHLLDQFFAKVDGSVLVLVFLDHLIDHLPFVVAKFNLRLRVQPEQSLESKEEHEFNERKL